MTSNAELTVCATERQGMPDGMVRLWWGCRRRGTNLPKGPGGNAVVCVRSHCIKPILTADAPPKDQMQ